MMTNLTLEAVNAVNTHANKTPTEKNGFIIGDITVYVRMIETKKGSEKLAIEVFSKTYGFTTMLNKFEGQFRLFSKKVTWLTDREFSVVADHYVAAKDGKKAQTFWTVMIPTSDAELIDKALIAYQAQNTIVKATKVVTPITNAPVAIKTKKVAAGF